MLVELHVKDLALVDDVWLEFGPGFTVLTGETGAGKTVLVEALKLLLGDRADSTMVRSGAAEAVIEGRFEIDGRELVAKRRVGAEGRSKCTIDGEMTTVGALAESLGPLVDLHGQHDHQALLHPQNHAGYLDRFIGSDAEVALSAYRAALAETSAALLDLRGLEESLADRERQADYLRFQVGDIDSVRPTAGEDAEIESAIPRLRHAEKLAEAAAIASRSLGDEGGAWEVLSAGLSALAPAAGLDPDLDAMRDEIAALATSTDDLRARLRTYRDQVEHDPRALDEAEGRLAQLAALKRKYGPTLDDVLKVREDAEERLTLLDAGEEGLERARVRVNETSDTLRLAAERLRNVRVAAARRFEESLSAAAAELSLPKAVFRVEFEEVAFESWTQDGPDRVEFLFSSSPGDSPRPLARIASGGETSRVMLALKGVLGSADGVPILVFDEVDAGIGGATALSVGERLAGLAGRHQVLVITHLAQVAAFANRQVVVYKDAAGVREVTRAREVRDLERVEEIARMLSGGGTDTGLAHARELLDSVATR